MSAGIPMGNEVKLPLFHLLNFIFRIPLWFGNFILLRDLKASVKESIPTQKEFGQTGKENHRIFCLNF